MDMRKEAYFMNENLVAQIVNGAKAEKTSIPAELIRPNKYNFYEYEKFYKKNRDAETGEDIELRSLEDGIASVGQMENIVVYRDESINDGKKYTLLSGQRRWQSVLNNKAKGIGSGELDATIRPKPKNDFEETMLIIEGNKRRRTEVTVNQFLYQEILFFEMLYDKQKKEGNVPKGLWQRKYVSQMLGVSEGTINKVHNKYDKSSADLPDKKKTKAKKQSTKQQKFNELADEISEQVSAFCTKVELTQSKISFKYDTLTDLEHLLEEFGIDVDISELKKYLLGNKEDN